MQQQQNIFLKKWFTYMHKLFILVRIYPRDIIFSNLEIYEFQIVTILLVLYLVTMLILIVIGVTRFAK